MSRSKGRTDGIHVTVEGLVDAVDGVLGMFEADAIVAVDQATLDVAEVTRDEIKAEAKRLFKGKKYWKSWTIAKEYLERGTIRTVYSRAPYYRLTHLLENGHATVGTKATKPYVAGRKHIAPAADKAEQRLMDAIKKRIEEASENRKRWGSI